MSIDGVMSTSKNHSLLVRIGGERILRKAIHLLYEKIFSDNSLRPYFTGVDQMGLTNKMNQIFITICSDFDQSKLTYLRSTHARAVSNGLDDIHFDHMAGHLRSTFFELKIEKQFVDEFLERIEETRPIVLGR